MLSSSIVIARIVCLNPCHAAEEVLWMHCLSSEEHNMNLSAKIGLKDILHIVYMHNHASS